jgi:pyruvate dehydrogenase E1 component
VNDEVVHGIPGPRRLRAGDVVSIDTGCKYKGWCGDAAATRPVGAVSPEVQALLDVTRGVLALAIEAGQDPKLLQMVAHLTDEQLERLSRGGHDPEKIYAGYQAAIDHTGAPTCVICQTIKGYGLGESGEGLNITHQQKKLNEDALKRFRTRFQVPLSDEQVADVPFYHPGSGSREIKYLNERRKQLGGHLPKRFATEDRLKAPGDDAFAEFFAGTGDREVSSTMAFVRILARLLQEEGLGQRVVPMIPDEARTFGMDALFRQVGIYSHCGQLYEPVDRQNLLYYREATDGQILEEGITEAGCLSSFIAAGTAHANHGVSMIPFFTFYSMFGFQRVGDSIWCAADSRCKGFLMGATAGRTTLAGEGLQHQDGNSHLLALPVPNLKAYDPAFAYELAVIIQDGIRRMYEEDEDVFYYITLMNDNYAMPQMPEGAREGILKGLYRFQGNPADADVQLIGSGAILPEALKAADLLGESYGVTAAVWSATSYKELHYDAMSVERWNRNHSGEKTRVPYVTQVLSEASGPVVAASDYVRALPETIARHVPNRFTTLGTDGFGRSDGRPALRRFFEVDAANIAFTALVALAEEGRFDKERLKGAARDLEIDTEAADPVTR